jgi:hypothetical protein
MPTQIGFDGEKKLGDEILMLGAPLTVLRSVRTLSDITIFRRISYNLLERGFELLKGKEAKQKHYYG